VTRRYESGIGLGLAAGVIRFLLGGMRVMRQAFWAWRQTNPGQLTTALYQYDDRRSARSDNPRENVGTILAGRRAAR
jgi:hypothetical protein